MYMLTASGRISCFFSLLLLVTVLDGIHEMVFALVDEEVTDDVDIGFGIDILVFNELFRIIVDGIGVAMLELVPLFIIVPYKNGDINSI